MWALRLIYAGAQSPATAALLGLGAGTVLALALGSVPIVAAASAARRDDQRRAAGQALLASVAAVAALGALLAAWIVFDRPATSYLGEVWYVIGGSSASCCSG